MAYRVDLTARAVRDLRRIWRDIEASESAAARAWFDGLEAAVFGLDEHPARSPATPEDRSLRHLLYGRGRHVWRIIYAIDERVGVVTVLHIRHGAHQPLTAPGGP